MKPDKHSVISLLFEMRWVALVSALFFIAQSVAKQKQLLDTMIWVTVGLTLLIWPLFWFYRLRDRKRRAEVRDRFKNYFSPQIADGILSNPEKMALGGERREISILFSDIRSFTRMSEDLPPKKLIELTQEYFTEMTAEIEATGGVVDKFIGDAIMAFWGAPTDQLDKADRAVTTAVTMVQKLETLNERWQRKGFPPISIGVGIHTGIAIVGNIGSKNRFDYTVIGDDVNIASRIERLTREFKTNIIISESTKKSMTAPFDTECLGIVKIRGRRKGIEVYSVRT